jgi:hypothetical protein
MTPLMPYFAMNSKARSEPDWIGCQHSTGSRSGAGTNVISFNRIRYGTSGGIV